MIDQSHIDLVQLVGGGVKKVALTQGGEYAGACPFCGGRDRFRVWPERGRWWCRQCERHGDAVGFVQQREQVSFREALSVLGLSGQARTYQPAPTLARPPEPGDPPPAAWQEAARTLVEQSRAHLYGDYPKPLHYLHRRGFTEATIAAAQIGYQPRDEWVPRSAWGLEPDGKRTHLWVPRGVVIPWFVQGHLWKLFIRRPIPPNAWEAVRRPPPDTPAPTGTAAQVLRVLRGQREGLTEGALARACQGAAETVQAALATLHETNLVRRPTKHYQVPGGSNAVYNADAIDRERPVMLVEAALDALAIQQAAGDLVAAAATGTTGGRTVRWIGRLLQSPLALLAFDNDPGGDTPTSYWRDVLRERAHIWRPATDDPAAMLEQGQDVRGWVMQGLGAAGMLTTALETGLFAAADAGDWEEARALAAQHPDPVGVVRFLTDYQAVKQAESAA